MIVAGFGFRTGASSESFADALDKAAGGRDVDACATLTEKADALKEFTSQIGVRLITVSFDAAQQVETLTLSDTSLAIKALGSVAEATALAAAGPNAALLAQRSISSDGLATCALAEGPTP